MDDITINTYNKIAEKYDDIIKDFWVKFPINFIDEFVKNLSKNPDVLDVGSGSGRDALLLQGKGASVICLDASQNMIDTCVQKGQEIDISRHLFENVQQLGRFFVLL